MILKVDGKLVGLVPSNELRYFYEINDRNSTMKHVTLSEAGEDIGSLQIRIVSLEAESTESIALLHNWTSSCNLRQALDASLIRSQPAPRDGQLDREWLAFLLHLVTSTKLSNIQDPLTDIFLGYLKQRRLEDLDEIYALYKGTRRPRNRKAHHIFANLLLHHRENFLEDSGLKPCMPDEVESIAMYWIGQAWKTKDWTAVPQDILAEDFNDHCRYHKHGNHPCYCNQRT